MVVYQLEDAVKRAEEKIREHPFPTFVGQSPPEEEVRKTTNGPAFFFFVVNDLPQTSLTLKPWSRHISLSICVLFAAYHINVWRWLLVHSRRAPPFSFATGLLLSVHAHVVLSLIINDLA